MKRALIIYSSPNEDQLEQADYYAIHFTIGEDFFIQSMDLYELLKSEFNVQSFSPIAPFNSKEELHRAAYFIAESLGVEEIGLVSKSIVNEKIDTLIKLDECFSTFYEQADILKNMTKKENFWSKLF